jgi:hypothetical protein
MEHLILGGNPISAIETGAFSPLTNITFIDLWKTDMTEIDLSIFPFLESKSVRWNLDYSSKLKSIFVTDISKVSLFMIC